MSSISFAFGANSVFDTGTAIKTHIDTVGTPNSKRYLLIDLDEVKSVAPDPTTIPNSAEDWIMLLAYRLAEVTTADNDNQATSQRRFEVTVNTPTFDTGFFLENTNFTVYNLGVALYSTATPPQRPPLSSL